MGPRNPVSDKFDPNDVLVELDRFMKHCEGKFIDKELLTDINVKTLNYIKKCKSLKCSRNLMLTKKYLIARIAYNVFNMDTKVGFIAKLPLILGGFFELG